jgi:uncharacterized protein YbjT (DUF2867 family)
MRVLLFGASGMVGQGVLHECLASMEVSDVLAVVREPLATIPALKLRDLQHKDFFDWSGVDFSGFDACFFCLGVSSLGKSEAEYRRVTYDLTMAAAQAVLASSPQAVFVYVSGLGTDSSEKGRSMWARVKGATENALLRMPFHGVYCFRPGYIQPLHGVRSKVGWYNGFYAVLSWAYPLLQRVLPGMVTSTEEVGRAMLHVARDGYAKHVLESRDIRQAAMSQAAGGQTAAGSSAIA